MRLSGTYKRHSRRHSGFSGLTLMRVLAIGCNRKTLRKIIIVLMAAAIFGPLYSSGFVSAFISGFEGRNWLLPCDSSDGQSGAKEAFDRLPSAKSAGVKIIALRHVNTISASPDKVECKAVIVLSSGIRAVMNYSFTSDPSLGMGKYVIRSSIQPHSLKPF